MSSVQVWIQGVRKINNGSALPILIEFFCGLVAITWCCVPGYGQGQSNSSQVDWSLPWDADQLGLDDESLDSPAIDSPATESPATESPLPDRPAFETPATDSKPWDRKLYGSERNRAGRWDEVPDESSRWTTNTTPGFRSKSETRQVPTQSSTEARSRFDTTTRQSPRASEVVDTEPSGIIHGLRLPSSQQDRPLSRDNRRDGRASTNGRWPARTAQIPTQSRFDGTNSRRRQSGQSELTDPEYIRQQGQEREQVFDPELDLETADEASPRTGVSTTRNGRKMFDTQSTSLGPPPGSTDRIRPNLSQRGNAVGKLPLTDPQGTLIKPGDAEDNERSRRRNSAQNSQDVEEDSPGSTDEDPAERIPSWAPLLLTMGLFASIAGNFFFGWVAWDTHARYQDLVDDMSESDARLDRQARRLRDADEPAPRRFRNRDRNQDVELVRESS